MRKECVILLTFSYNRTWGAWHSTSSVQFCLKAILNDKLLPAWLPGLGKAPSQLDENFPSFFLASLRILQTRSPFWKHLGRTFVLYRLEARALQAASRILLLSQNSLTKSRLTARLSSFRVRSNICRLMVGSATSTGIMASVPYVRL